MDYFEIENAIKQSGYTNKDLPLSFTNEEGDTCILDTSVADGERCYFTLTAQSNNWTRRNVYYPDGTSEELYER